MAVLHHSVVFFVFFTECFNLGVYPFKRSLLPDSLTSSSLISSAIVFALLAFLLHGTSSLQQIWKEVEALKHISFGSFKFFHLCSLPSYSCSSVPREGGEEWEEELLAYTEAQLYWHAPKHPVILAEQAGAKMNVLLHGMDS